MKPATQLFPNIWKFNQQFFYSEPVGVYVIELPDTLLLFEIPEFTPEIKKFLTKFDKPIKALLSHGSTGIADGSKWQSELGVKVYLHETDRDYSWLRMQPDVLFNTVPNFGEGVTVIHTPGHSAGSVCLLYEPNQVLFTGDTLCGNTQGEIFEGSHNDDRQVWIQSCTDLLQYDFKHILPFHHQMIQDSAKEALQNLVHTLK